MTIHLFLHHRSTSYPVTLPLSLFLSHRSPFPPYPSPLHYPLLCPSLAGQALSLLILPTTYPLAQHYRSRLPYPSTFLPLFLSLPLYLFCSPPYPYLMPFFLRTLAFPTNSPTSNPPAPNYHSTSYRNSLKSLISLPFRTFAVALFLYPYSLTLLLDIALSLTTPLYFTTLCPSRTSPSY